MIGLFSVGLDTYWPQFPGLRERLEGYHARIVRRLTDLGVQVADAGLVDTPAAGTAAGARLRAADCELVVCYLATYALSAAVLPAVQAAGAPVLVLALQPGPAMDIAAINALGDRGRMTGEWLAWCQACSSPELANVFHRAGIPWQAVQGYLDDEVAWGKIACWVRAARVRRRLRRTTVGILGRNYDGMLDVWSDITALQARLGTQFAVCEPERVVRLREQVSTNDAEAMQAELARTFRIDPACSRSELERAARTAAALERLCAERGLGALAYYFEGEDGTAVRDVVTSLIPGATLLTGRGIPCAGECEIKNVLAMTILDELGAGGSFSEFYAADFTDDIVMLGHDGPGHPGIADGPVRLVPLPVYHGKPGVGLSIGLRVRLGPVTTLSLVQRRDGGLCLLAAEGASVEGPTLDIGNTNSRYRFACGARRYLADWSAAGPSHHCAVGVGHQLDAIRCVAALLEADLVTV
jgi:L-arabinose isomerase